MGRGSRLFSCNITYFLSGLSEITETLRACTKLRGVGIFALVNQDNCFEFINVDFCFIFRNEQHQDALWKYSIECLKGYVDENLLSECGFLFNESEVKELFSSKQEET